MLVHINGRTVGSSDVRAFRSCHAVLGIIGGRVVVVKASPGGLAVKNLPAVQERGVLSLGWEDSLEEGIATHSSTLAWKIPWTEEPGEATVHGVAESDTTEAA